MGGTTMNQINDECNGVKITVYSVDDVVQEYKEKIKEQERKLLDSEIILDLRKDCAMYEQCKDKMSEQFMMMWLASYGGRTLDGLSGCKNCNLYRKRSNSCESL